MKIPRVALFVVDNTSTRSPLEQTTMNPPVCFPVVSCNGLHGHFFFGNQGLPFLFRLETPERRVVGVFVLENLFATFLVVAGIRIGGGTLHWLTSLSLSVESGRIPRSTHSWSRQRKSECLSFT